MNNVSFSVTVFVLPIVLFDRASFPARVASVPVVGRVTFVVPVCVRVNAKAPEVVKLSPSVIVLPVLATPVPPYCPKITDPFQTPVAIVPTDVNDDDTTFDARVVPVNVPAGAITTDVPAAVINPLPLTVKFGIAVDDPKDPTFPLTVANVRPVAPDDERVPVASPVNVSPDSDTVPERSGSVYVRLAVRSSFVTVPVNEFAPAAVTEIDRTSELAVALSTVNPRIVAPPVNELAVDVVAPRPVTLESVSASAVR